MAPLDPLAVDDPGDRLGRFERPFRVDRHADRQREIIVAEAYRDAQKIKGEGDAKATSTYAQAFGTDPARQRALSPTLHAGGPNAPEFLILHVQRQDGTRQSRELGETLPRCITKQATLNH